MKGVLQNAMEHVLARWHQLDTRKNRMILAGYDVSAGRAISFWPDRYDPGPI